MPRKIGLAGGLGARYGTIARRQYVEILTGLRSKHECPRCRFNTVKRASVGIWLCRKCGHKFAGGAYAPSTKLGEIATRATRGLMSPSTLSTELDSLRAGAKVAQSILPPVRRTRTRRRKITPTEPESVLATTGEKTDARPSSSSKMEREETVEDENNIETSSTPVKETEKNESEKQEEE